MHMLEIDVLAIDPSPYQHRRHFDQVQMQELARSIKDDGLIQPITVRKNGDRFELIAGERRWRACKQFAGLETISARVIECNDLQARRLCAVENLQRADLTAIEEVHALAELIDAEMMLAFGNEYSSLSRIQEPKWRVKSLLTLIESDRRNGTEKVTNKIVGKTELVFGALPKPKDHVSFTNHDLPLLFTSDEVQRFAMQHRLNKSQTRAVSNLVKEGGESAKAALSDDTGQAFIDLIQQKTDAESVEDVRDFAAGDITKAVSTMRRDRRMDAKAIDLPEPEPARELNIDPGWYRVGSQYLYCGSNLDQEFIDRIPSARFAFADPPYNANVDEWDNDFEWRQDYLQDLAEVVAVTPGGWNAAEFYRQTKMTYQWEMACWIRNGMTHGRCGFANWIKTSIFGKKTKIQQDFFDITIKTNETVDTAHKGRKPYPFMGYLLDAFTEEGEVVIDPFAGSGTTLLMSEKMGRVSYNAEISTEFCAQIIERAKAIGVDHERL